MRLATSRRFFAAALLPLLFWGTSVVAAPPASVPPADVRAVQRVIQAQLNAFAADDHKTAFSLATPGIRARFGTSEIFLAMVQESYPMVYRPTNVVFQKPVAVGKDLVQQVVFSDADGDEWLATYRLQRQKNKAWRIDGCVIAPSAGRAA